MKIKAAILPLAILVITSSCGLRKNNGSGYGGGDPLLAVLHDQQLKIGDTAKLIRSAVDAEALCSARQCQFPNDKSQCSLLDGLSAAQRSYCASVVQASAEWLQDFSSRSLGDSFLITNEAISVADAQGRPVPVAAKTILGHASPIIINRERLNSLNGSQILALLVHEVGHQNIWMGKPISDNEAIGPFGSGRALLDAVGSALAVYHNDHIQRPGAVDYSFFNGRRTVPLGEVAVLKGRVRSETRLELVTSPLRSLEAGVVDLFGELVGSLDFLADDVEYRASPEVLDLGEYDPQIVPALSGDTVYITNKFEESTGSSITASRFKSDGTIDASFGDNSHPGRIQLSRSDLAADQYEFIIDGQVDSLNRLHFGECISEEVSYICSLIRLKTDGSRDVDYNSLLASEIETRLPGSSVTLLKLLSDRSTAVLLRQRDGSPVMIRVQESGAIDSEFGVGGISQVETHSPPDADFDSALEVVSLEVANGKILLVERNSTGERVVLSRYTSRGLRDLNFGTGGVYRVSPSLGQTFIAEKVLFQPDGKILVVGLLNGVLLKTLRLDQRGNQDPVYGELGVSLIVLGNSAPIFVDASVDSGGALTVVLSGESFTTSGNEITVMKLQP